MKEDRNKNHYRTRFVLKSDCKEYCRTYFVEDRTAALEALEADHPGDVSWVETSILQKVFAPAAVMRACSFVEISDLLPMYWAELWYAIRENGAFSWGDNNRSLVTARSLREHISSSFTYDLSAPISEDGISAVIKLEGVSQPIVYDEFKLFMNTLEELEDTYIDLEN